MPDALTTKQIELLCRVREVPRWYRRAREDWELREAMFLCDLGLLHYVGLPRLFDLTAFGHAYLSAIDESRQAAGPADSP